MDDNENKGEISEHNENKGEMMSEVGLVDKGNSVRLWVHVTGGRHTCRS